MKGLMLAVHGSCVGESLRDSVESAQRLGFSGISLDVVSSLVDTVSLSVSGHREVRHLLARNDQALASLRARVPGGALTSDLDRLLWHLQRCLSAAAALRATCLSLDVGRLPPPRRTAPVRKAATQRQAGLILLPGSIDLPVPEEPPADPDELALWPAVEQAIDEIARLADRHGQRIALSSELSPTESLGQLLQHAACPLLGLELDPVAVLRDRWDAAKTVSELGGSILMLRGRDALKGAGGRTQPVAMGRGSTDWEQLLHLLDEGGYRGWLTVDTLELSERSESAARALSYLRQIMRVG